MHYAQQMQSELDQQTEKLGAEIAEKDAAIATLTGEISEKEAAIETLTGENSEKDATIEALNAEIADRDATIARLNGEIADLQTMLSIYNPEDEEGEAVYAAASFENGISVDEDGTSAHWSYSNEGSSLNKQKIVLSLEGEEIAVLTDIEPGAQVQDFVLNRKLASGSYEAMVKLITCDENGEPENTISYPVTIIVK